MLKYPCLVLDHDDTVVQSEATVNYPCFVEFLKIYRPDTVYTLADYVSDCGKMSFVDLCRQRFHLTDEELLAEYHFWQNYSRSHIPAPFPGIKELLLAYRQAGGKICVASMSSAETILRDYRVHFGFQPDMIFGCDLPAERRKPNTWLMGQILEQFGFSKEQLLVVDDMTLAVPMARNAGCPMAFAAWGRLNYPEVYEEMERRCDYLFRTPKALQDFLLEEYPMAREERAEFTNMCMITDGAGNVLVIDRQNPDWPGITFPGGHVEPGEAFTESVIREVREETGLTVEDPVLCGIKQFQTDSDARYVVFFYKAGRYTGSLQSSNEGEVFWISREALPRQKLSVDMMEMVRVMESENLSEFYYFTEDGSWKYKLL